MINSFTRLPFTIWISRFRHENSDKGIFARWMDSSELIMKHSDEQFIKKIRRVGGTETLIEIFRKVWEEFETIPKAKITIPTRTGFGKKYSRLD